MQTEQELDVQIDRFIKENELQFLNDLHRVLSIGSVRAEPKGKMRFGENCGKMLDAMLQMGKDYGFTAKNGDYYYGVLSMGDTENSLGMICHLDVVPAGEGWTVPPFGLTQKGGYCLGRGVEDDKGPALCALYAMRFLKEHSLPMKHGAQLVLGSDEESGMSDIRQFLKNEPLPVFSFTPDADYPVCHGEKGIFEADIVLDGIGKSIADFTGGVAANVVPAKASVTLKNHTSQSLEVILKENSKTFEFDDTKDGVKITASGVAAHAASPEKGVSAIGLLVSLLCDYSLAEESELSALRFIRSILDNYKGSGLSIPFEDKESGYTTCIAGKIKAENEKLILNINIRYAVTQDGDRMAARIEEICAENGAVLQIHSNSKPHFISADTPVVKELTKISNQVLGTNKKSYVMGGGTYARRIPNCVAFGPNDSSRKKPFPAGTGDIHQPDEAAELSLMLQSIKIFIRALLAMDQLVK